MNAVRPAGALWRGVAAFGVWPLLMGGSLVAAWWGFAAGYPTAVWSFVVSAANVVLIIGLEQVLPVRPSTGLLRDAQLPRDIGHGLLIGGLGRPLASQAALGLLALGALVVTGPPRADRWPSALPAVVQIVLALAVWSLVGYWTHRLYHRVGVLWPFHAVHHDVTQMHVFKGNRIHLGEDVVRQFVALVPLYLIGAPTQVLVWVALWNNFEGAAAHANIDQRFPAWAHVVLPTPADHYLHHGIERANQEANFAAVTPLWDVLFGTFRHPGRHAVAAVGVEGTPVPERFAAQLRYPFRARRDTPDAGVGRAIRSSDRREPPRVPGGTR